MNDAIETKNALTGDVITYLLKFKNSMTSTIVHTQVLNVMKGTDYKSAVDSILQIIPTGFAEYLTAQGVDMIDIWEVTAENYIITANTNFAPTKEWEEMNKAFADAAGEATLQ